ncbi:site-2 protease family protein [Candidatus Saccharibacteria bacterium oral taxon 488]|jgi:Zn-dependent membrane-bound protease, M50 family protein|nr:site-2 protease family protein [Candidatus Saccharibacteria bacterium oral taxon 488]QJU10695.1 site-2 protease family protein [Candidatus Saccharibacteria bacterium oral taxon 488]QLF51582.1 site-2 protease family protein [Candidatus Saccharibacteria bacterium oral taxon 488]
MVIMDLAYLGMVLVVILVSMTLHEAMHAFMGYFLGDDTAKAEGRLTLNPLKHIDPFMTLLLPLLLAMLGLPIFGGARPVPFNPQRVRHGEWGAAFVALAGPLTNLFLAFLAFGVGVVSGVITSGGLIQNILVGQIISLVVLVNLGFFVFNMLPLPPLDGSRVLYALAPEGVRRGMEWIERYGVMVVFIIIMIGQAAIGRIMAFATNGIIQFFCMIFGV